LAGFMGLAEFIGLAGLARGGRVGGIDRVDRVGGVGGVRVGRGWTGRMVGGWTIGH